ncbi:hypothetical protein G9A89_010020 [Geosiphon pyriformis]|nr:hypothetical protein G9A89_010020 [Geosiphon pyriformis]
MQALKSKGSFEFTLFEVSKVTGEVYSPPFATSDDMFWQLKFVASYKEEPDYFSLFLCAIPNGEEEYLTTAWTRRSTVSATLFLRSPHLHCSSESSTSSQYVKTFTIGMENFCAKWAGYGLNRFYKKSLLPDEFTLGVDFDKTVFKPLAQAGPLPAPPVAENLLEAWTAQLNQTELADVQFDVQGHMIYAHSSILSKRSEYFQKIFQQKWSEFQKKSSSSESAYAVPLAVEKPIINNKSVTENSTISVKYFIKVTDFNHITFLEMLRFLYTDKVIFDKREGSQKTALAMFSIADKYLIFDLRQRAKAKLCRDLNDYNAAELLFGMAWKWPDIKDHVLKYVADNFNRIRKTPNFQHIEANPVAYPCLGELMLELVQLLVPLDKKNTE